MSTSVSEVPDSSPGSGSPPASAEAKPYIEINQLSKRFGAFTAVDEVSLDIFKGEFFALLGGSGCGKTTLLRMLAGFESPTSGSLRIDGVDMANIPPYDRPVNMMFQSYALFPHMTVAKNVAYGLKRDKVPSSDINDRVDEMLEMVEMQDFGKRKPSQLSGGQRQRVALARSLVKQPKVLLLDEPLAALDKRLREQTQFELMNIQDKLGITFVVVTHDQEEAMTLATRIAVMDQGRFMQIGTPADIYENPNSRFIADFIGSANFIEGTVVSVSDRYHFVEVFGGSHQLSIESDQSFKAGDSVTVSVRPEKILLGKGHGPRDEFNTLHGVVEELAYLGRLSTYRVKLPSGEVLEVTSANRLRSRDGNHPIEWDDEVTLSFDPSAAIMLQG